jgi:hypothetical protein
MIITELRASKSLPSGKKAVRVGYFNDPEKFAAAARLLNDAGFDIYTPVNPIKPEVATDLNETPKRGRAVHKTDIARRGGLFYDFDVDRPKGKAASDAEIEAARPAIQRCVDDWRRVDVTPEVKHTGNGFQLKVLINLPNDAFSELLVKKVLEVHKAKYDIPGVVHLDCFKDANRICRVPGYKNWKGDGSLDRPQRTVKALNEASGGSHSGDARRYCEGLDETCSLLRHCTRNRSTRPRCSYCFQGRLPSLGTRVECAEGCA